MSIYLGDNYQLNWEEIDIQIPLNSDQIWKDNLENIKLYHYIDHYYYLYINWKYMTTNQAVLRLIAAYWLKESGQLVNDKIHWLPPRSESIDFVDCIDIVEYDWPRVKDTMRDLGFEIGNTTKNARKI